MSVGAWLLEKHILLYWCVLVNYACSTFALTWGPRAACIMASLMTVMCPMIFSKCMGSTSRSVCFVSTPSSPRHG